MSKGIVGIMKKYKCSFNQDLTDSKIISAEHYIEAAEMFRVNMTDVIVSNELDDNDKYLLSDKFFRKVVKSGLWPAEEIEKAQSKKDYFQLEYLQRKIEGTGYIPQVWSTLPDCGEW